MTPDLNAGIQTEVLILRNPFYHKVAAPEAFDVMIKDGSWLPLLFGVIQSVVERHFFELCDLNWDYVNNESEVPEGYVNYKAFYCKNLNEEQTRFIESVANELEEELAVAARETLAARENEGETGD